MSSCLQGPQGAPGRRPLQSSGEEWPQRIWWGGDLQSQWAGVSVKGLLRYKIQAKNLALIQRDFWTNLVLISIVFYLSHLHGSLSTADRMVHAHLPGPALTSFSGPRLPNNWLLGAPSLPTAGLRGLCCGRTLSILAPAVVTSPELGASDHRNLTDGPDPWRPLNLDPSGGSNICFFFLLHWS